MEVIPVEETTHDTLREPSEVIAELIRAGDRLDMVADLYELSRDEVEAAVRYELTRVAPIGAAA